MRGVRVLLLKHDRRFVLFSASPLVMNSLWLNVAAYCLNVAARGRQCKTCNTHLTGTHGLVAPSRENYVVLICQVNNRQTKIYNCFCFPVDLITVEYLIQLIYK